MLHTSSPPVSATPFTTAQILAELREHSQIESVADATARAQYVTDVEANGVTISAANPVFVWRQDSKVIEWSDDGDTWSILTGKAGSMPYAVEQGETSVTMSSGTGLNEATVNFTSGRFTVAPFVQITQRVTANASTAYVCEAVGLTTTSFTLRSIAVKGTASGSETFRWLAVQMTSAAAEG